MVYKVTHKTKNPLITYLNQCLHNTYDFVGKILLDNDESITITNNTNFRIHGDYIELITPSYPNACVKISHIIGVVV